MFVWTNLIVWIAGALQELLWALHLARDYLRHPHVDRAESLQPDRPLYLSATQPVFDFVREHIPVVFGGIDLSPIIVILGWNRSDYSSESPTYSVWFRPTLSVTQLAILNCPPGLRLRLN